MIRPNSLLKIYVAKKAAANSVVTAHCHPRSPPQGITMRNFGKPFSAACSHVRFQAFGGNFSFPRQRRSRLIGAHSRRQARRRRLNKLSCAGWLPHDRGFVSGLPHSKDERRSGDRLITGQEGSPPRSYRRQCAPADLLLSTSLCCCGPVWWLW